MEQKFYICEHCGNIVAMVKNAGVPVMCCGQKMTEIVPGTTDAAVEKHIPVYQVEGNLVKVRVGSVEHPMLPEHYIEWVSLQTRQGNQRKALHPGDKPEVCFALCEGDQVEAVYAYCNLHSLWKAEMEFQSCFPIWDKLSEIQQNSILDSLAFRQIKKGTVIHSGSMDCTGLLLVKSGQLRAYILSEEGREVTIYRLFDRDICLFSASCMLRSAQFDVTIEAERDTELWVIPAETYRKIMEESAPAANYTNEIMAARFSEVMWLVEQIMWKSMDKRVAAFLLEESAIEGGDRLTLTHETIARHLGTHREVVTRMLRYLQSEGMVKLSRGAVELLDEQGLAALGDA